MGFVLSDLYVTLTEVVNPDLPRDIIHIRISMSLVPFKLHEINTVYNGC